VGPHPARAPRRLRLHRQDSKRDGLFRVRRAFPFLLFLLCSACTHHLAALQQPGRAVAFPTFGPWRSMVYAAATDSGVVLVDLGWLGSAGRLRGKLRTLDATPEQVSHVFLTHSHRDHIGAWRSVAGARFHLWAPEVPLFEGTQPHADLPSRLARSVSGHSGPLPGQVTVQAFSADTAFLLGADTLLAYPLPGHTVGSAAYLFRGILFVGDAIARRPLRGFVGAHPLFSDDPRQNRESLRALFARVPLERVEWVCNAHAKCARPEPRFLHKVTGSDR
jgi:glyoxylase-like metal-dependent hydrolase (beta-lactamase superfamily II)